MHFDGEKNEPTKDGFGRRREKREVRSRRGRHPREKHRDLSPKKGRKKVFPKRLSLLAEGKG